MEKHNWVQCRDQQTVRTVAPMDMSVAHTQETSISLKKEWKMYKSHNARKIALRLCFLKMAPYRLANAERGKVSGCSAIRQRTTMMSQR